jgi:ATP-dependent DNA helicase Q4
MIMGVQVTSGRVIARIFHGISSPQYPAIDWSRNYMWRRYAGVDFNVIRIAAQREIRRARLAVVGELS